jgi:molybdenum cofactor synthesis domain-containing protein
VVAGEDVPPFANSAVDGYAVIAADVATAPVELTVVGEVAAGAHTDRVLAAGEAIRIMTGAPVPAGADAMVMVEDTERLEGGARVLVRRSVQRGDAVRTVGDDVLAGTPLFAPGAVVTPPVAGVLASVNVRTLAVVPRARVAVMSTGDELVDDGAPLGPGQIRESNKTMLLGMIAAVGAEAVDYGVVRDDEAVLEATLRRAADQCDAIVTSGGVSMGDYDVVKAVLGRIAEMRWMQIAIKPAKPFAFGVLAASDGRVRAARQPGQLDGELRAVRPTGAAADDGPRRQRAGATAGRGRRSHPPQARRQDPLRPCARRVRGRRSVPRPTRGWPGQSSVGGHGGGHSPGRGARRRRHRLRWPGRRDRPVALG